MSIKAVGTRTGGGLEVLEIVDLPKPNPGDQDLLVKVYGFALNPIDTKMRKGAFGAPEPGTVRVLGWDASGVVESVGSGVKGYAVGDEVYFAGNVFGPGSAAEYAVIDHRIVAHKPKTLNHVVAASVPLTLLTAWEAFEDKLRIPVPAPGSAEEKLNASKTVLVVAGAGGVGSIAVQLAKKIFKFGKVVATAGRADSQAWALKQGADVTLDRSRPYEAQLKDLGISGFDYILSCSSIDDILDQLISISKPFGQICSIVETHKPLDLSNMFAKAVGLSFEFMSTRPLFNVDLERQHTILAQGAALIDNGTLQPWVGTTYDKATLETVRAGHVLQESGTAIGKITFDAKF